MVADLTVTATERRIVFKKEPVRSTTCETPLLEQSLTCGQRLRHP